MQQQPGAGGRPRLGPVQVRPGVHVVDQDVHVAVVVEVAEGRAAPGPRDGDRRPQPLGDVLEPACDIAVHHLPLGIGGFTR